MTPDEICKLADELRLERDEYMPPILDALADVVEAQPRCMHRENGGPECPCLHSQALARVEALKP